MKKSITHEREAMLLEKVLTANKVYKLDCQVYRVSPRATVGFKDSQYIEQRRYNMKIKQRFCKHNFIPVGEEKETGETLGRNMKPTKEFQQDYECTKCKKIKLRKYIYFGGTI